MADVEQWIEHDGSPCPVRPNVWVYARYRGDADPAKGIMRMYGLAHQFHWHHDGAEDDIIAYRMEPTP